MKRYSRPDKKAAAKMQTGVKDTNQNLNDQIHPVNGFSLPGPIVIIGKNNIKLPLIYIGL
jgi:hypothetical protein